MSVTKAERVGHSVKIIFFFNAFYIRIFNLFDGLTMRTVLRFRAAGLMHSLIYIGFLGLFAGTITLEIHHLMPPSLKFLQGTTYIVYSFTLELATIAY